MMIDSSFLSKLSFEQMAGETYLSKASAKFVAPITMTPSLGLNLKSSKYYNKTCVISFKKKKCNKKPLTYPSISASSWLMVCREYGCIGDSILFPPTLSSSSINITHGALALASSVRKKLLLTAEALWAMQDYVFP